MRSGKTFTRNVLADWFHTKRRSGDVVASIPPRGSRACRNMLDGRRGIGIRADGEPEEGDARPQVGRPACVWSRRDSVRGRYQGGGIFAIDTGERASAAAKPAVEVNDLAGKIAAMLGTNSEQIMINDLAVNPLSGNVYLSVSRGRGPTPPRCWCVPMPTASSRKSRSKTCRSPRPSSPTCLQREPGTSRSPTSRTPTAACSSPGCPTKSCPRG